MYTLISNVESIPDSSGWRIFSSPNVQSWQFFLFCKVLAPFELETTTGNWNEKEKQGKWDVMKGKCYIDHTYI